MKSPMGDRVTSAPDLRALPFFARLPDEAIRALNAGLRTERLPQGTAMGASVGPPETLAFICSGRVKRTGACDGGDAEMGPGWWFGADAVMLGPREQRTVVAAEDTLLATISRASIDDLLRRYLGEVLGATPSELPSNATDSVVNCDRGRVSPPTPLPRGEGRPHWHTDTVPPSPGGRGAGGEAREKTSSSVSHQGRPRIGLALSGGGAKAFAHLGILKVLIESHIPIDLVAGTSAGAIAGALFCAGKSVTEMLALAEGLRRHVLRREGGWDFLEPPTVGLIRGERTQALYDQMLDGASFDQMKTPLAIPAAEIVTGETVVLRNGSVSQAIRASAGIPGLYAPWPNAGRYLVEGGLVDPLPIDLARRMGADLVIASDVTGCPQEILGQTFEAQGPSLIGLITARSSAILSRHVANWNSDAEFLIRPDVKDYEVLDYPMAHDLIALGEEAALAALPEIHETLRMSSGVPRWPGASRSVSVPAGGRHG